MAQKKKSTKPNKSANHERTSQSAAEISGSNWIDRINRFHWIFGYDLELENQNEWAGYKNMLMQERNRILNHKKRYSMEYFRVKRISKAIKELDVPEHKQTNSLALSWLKSCLQLGILPPPWVAGRILEVIEAKSQKK